MQLHLKPEQVRQLATQLDMLAETVAHEANVLTQMLQRLVMTWDGSTGDNFMQHLQTAVHGLQQSHDEVQMLKRRLYRFVDTWEEIDRLGAYYDLDFTSGPAVQPHTAVAVTAVSGASMHTRNQTDTPGEQASHETTIPRPKSNWIARWVQLDEIDAEIERLEAMPERSPADDHQLRELQSQRQELQEALAAGVPVDGRDPASNPFPPGECTWFATSKRDLYPDVYGHAKYWAEQAAANGVEVGDIPIKGAVMVWQPGVFKAHEEFGHVSFVEAVERLADGSFKVFYTDNLNPDTIRNVVVSLETDGVDFIY